MILALDIATLTGWCAGRGDQLPDFGSVKMPSTGDEIGPFLSFWRKWLTVHMADIQPSVVVFEAPIIPAARFDRIKKRVVPTTTITTTRKLQGLAGVLEMVCHEAGVPVFETHVGTVKKELSGSGSATKMDMVACAKRCGLNPKVEDEADAFGVWLVAVRHHARQHREQWDRLIYKGQGLL